jgi:hypothetical protein
MLLMTTDTCMRKGCLLLSIPRSLLNRASSISSCSKYGSFRTGGGFVEDDAFADAGFVIFVAPF